MVWAKKDDRKKTWASFKYFSFTLLVQQDINCSLLYVQYVLCYWLTYTAKTQYRKFKTNIPRKGIAGPQSQFPHSCFWERFIYSHVPFACSAAGNMWTDPGNYINRSPTQECRNWDWDRAIPRKVIHKWDFRCSVFLSRCTPYNVLLYFSWRTTYSTSSTVPWTSTPALQTQPTAFSIMNNNPTAAAAITAASAAMRTISQAVDRRSARPRIASFCLRCDRRKIPPAAATWAVAIAAAVAFGRRVPISLWLAMCLRWNIVFMMGPLRVVVVLLMAVAPATSRISYMNPTPTRAWTL